MEVHFKDEVEFETIEIKVPRDVVFYSFIVHKSLVYLDLSACENTIHHKSVFTEEQCRKRMEPRRQILYTYHLDLPVNLEGSLRAVIPNEDDQEEGEAFYLGVMFTYENLYTRDLESCLVFLILSAVNKMENLRRYFNAMKLLKFHQNRKSALLLFEIFIHVLYPYCSDSNFVVELATTFRFSNWILYRENTLLVRYVLHHAIQIGYNICQIPESELDPINSSVAFKFPGNIRILLEFGVSFRFEKLFYLDFIGRHLKHRLLKRLFRKNIPDRRFFLILQLFYFFVFNYQYWESLRYIWRSIPDPFLSENEIRFLFRNVISSEDLNEMIEYYKLNIVEDTKDILDEAPRPLQHLCRVAIRSALSVNLQLPYGIGQLGMPTLIRHYLNLEC